MNDFGFMQGVPYELRRQEPPLSNYSRRGLFPLDGGFGSFPLGLPKVKQTRAIYARMQSHRKITGKTIVIYGSRKAWKSPWYVKWITGAITHEELHRLMFHMAGYHAGKALDVCRILECVY
jgi:hypothetical protein